MDDMLMAEASLPLFHAAFAIDTQWRSIGAYDKAIAPPVLLRGQGQMVLGQWGVLSDAIGGPAPHAWRSMEDSTLDSDLWFEPVEFAALKDSDERFFLQR
jgi:hypothetical protein